MFISLSELGGTDDDHAIAEFSVRALVLQSAPDRAFAGRPRRRRFSSDRRFHARSRCVAGPTLPREPIVAQLRSRSETAYAGSVTWRLINMLSPNHLGLVERGAGRNAQALRETLSMFADMYDVRPSGASAACAASIAGRSCAASAQRGGVGVARGVEITVTIDEKAFEGSGIFLLGAVLDRFFAEYSGFNHFTQTVIRSVERGEIMRWPARMGSRKAL